MTLKQEISANALSPSPSEKLRLKALFSERRARESTDERSKRDWEELAIQWHTMANLVADATRENFRLKL
jgi:hypothetical protein